MTKTNHATPRRQAAAAAAARPAAEPPPVALRHTPDDQFVCPLWPESDPPLLAKETPGVQVTWLIPNGKNKGSPMGVDWQLTHRRACELAEARDEEPPSEPFVFSPYETTDVDVMRALAVRPGTYMVAPKNMRGQVVHGARKLIVPGSLLLQAEDGSLVWPDELQEEIEDDAADAAPPAGTQPAAAPAPPTSMDSVARMISDQLEAGRRQTKETLELSVSMASVLAGNKQDRSADDEDARRALREQLADARTELKALSRELAEARKDADKDARDAMRRENELAQKVMFAELAAREAKADLDRAKRDLETAKKELDEAEDELDEARAAPPPHPAAPPSAGGSEVSLPAMPGVWGQFVPYIPAFLKWLQAQQPASPGAQAAHPQPAAVHYQNPPPVTNGHAAEMPTEYRVRTPAAPVVQAAPPAPAAPRVSQAEIDAAAAIQAYEIAQRYGTLAPQVPAPTTLHAQPVAQQEDDGADEDGEDEQAATG